MPKFRTLLIATTLAMVSLVTLPASDTHAQDCTTFNAMPRHPGLTGLAGLTNVQITGIIDTLDQAAIAGQHTINAAGNIGTSVHPAVGGMLLTEVVGVSESLGTLSRTYGINDIQAGVLIDKLKPANLNAGLGSAFLNAGGTAVLSDTQVNNFIQGTIKMPGVQNMDVSQLRDIFVNTANTSYINDVEIMRYFPGYSAPDVRAIMDRALDRLGTGAAALDAVAADWNAKIPFKHIAGIINNINLDTSLKNIYVNHGIKPANQIFAGIAAFQDLPGLKGLNGTQIGNTLNSVNNLLNRPDILGRGFASNVIVKYANEIPGLKSVLDALGSASAALKANDGRDLAMVLQALGSLNGLQGLSSKQLLGALQSLNQIQTLPGLAGMDLSGITNIYQGFSGLQQLNGINLGEINSILNSLPGGIDSLISNNAAAVFQGFAQVPSIDQVKNIFSSLGSIGSFDPKIMSDTVAAITGAGGSLNGIMGAFPTSISPQTVGKMFEWMGSQALGTPVTFGDMRSALSVLSADKLRDVFQGLPDAVIRGTVANIMALPAGMDALNFSNVKSLIGNVGGVTDMLRGASFDQIGGMFTNLQSNLLGGGINFNNALNAVTGMVGFKGLEGLTGLSNTDLTGLFKGLTSITQNGLQGLSMTQIGSVFQGIEGLQNLSGLAGLGVNLGSMMTQIQALSPADFSSLMSSFPQIQGVMEALPQINNMLGGAVAGFGGITNMNAAGQGSAGSVLGGLDLGAGAGGVTDALNNVTKTVDQLSGAAQGLASAMPSFLCPLPIEALGTISSFSSQIGSGSFLGSSPDKSAKNTPLRGGNVIGVKTNGCMTPKSTPRESFMTNYSPWLYKDVTDPGESNSLSVLSVYRGMGNTYSDKTDMIGLSPTAKSLAAADAPGCKYMFRDTGAPLTKQQARDVLDNCSNQYILFNSFLNTSLPMVDVGQFSKSIGPHLCQRWNMYPYTESDYDFKDIINKAWNKALTGNPYSGNGLNYDAAVLATVTKPTLTGNASINSVATGVERIYDPTHPFSPRQYFKGTERETFSPLTAGYGEVGPCTVACSAVPVDIMDWRRAKFTKCVTMRIGINYACMKNYWCRLAVGGKPPCSTRFDKRDRFGALCKPAGDIKKCCHELAKPIAPINALKLMKDDGQRPEGYVYKNYFGDHRPYLRWWDTGTEAGESGVSQPNYYTKKGAKDAIVGVGNEKFSCKYGGTGGGVHPMMSWTETKLYQARVFRDYGLNCLGSYEKLYKWAAAEDFVLSRAGAEYSQVVTTEKHSSTMSRQFPLGWRGYVSDPLTDSRFPFMFTNGSASAAMHKGLDNAQPGDIIIYDQDVFPAASKRLPLVSYVTQANNLKGYYDTVARVQKPVIGAEYIKVLDYNHGKFPDVCGVTDNWGISQERTIYKHRPAEVCPSGNNSHGLPCEVADFITDKRASAAGSDVAPDFFCDDPDMAYCAEPLWANIKIYRPSDDPR